MRSSAVRRSAVCLFFSSRGRHARFDCDWSSDVCSSDLHTPGLLRDRTGITELPATGLPLGLFSHATSDARIVALEPGASLLLVSLGLLEGKYKDEEFGLGRLKDTFLHANSDDARELCLSIINNVQQFMRTPPIHNDVTVLALVRAATAKALAVAG